MYELRKFTRNWYFFQNGMKYQERTYRASSESFETWAELKAAVAQIWRHLGKDHCAYDTGDYYEIYRDREKIDHTSLRNEFRNASNSWYDRYWWVRSHRQGRNRHHVCGYGRSKPRRYSSRYRSYQKVQIEEDIKLRHPNRFSSTLNFNKMMSEDWDGRWRRARRSAGWKTNRKTQWKCST